MIETVINLAICGVNFILACCILCWLIILDRKTPAKIAVMRPLLSLILMSIGCGLQSFQIDTDLIILHVLSHDSPWWISFSLQFLNWVGRYLFTAEVCVYPHKLAFSKEFSASLLPVKWLIRLVTQKTYFYVHYITLAAIVAGILTMIALDSPSYGLVYLFSNVGTVMFYYILVSSLAISAAVQFHKRTKISKSIKNFHIYLVITVVVQLLLSVNTNIIHLLMKKCKLESCSQLNSLEELRGIMCIIQRLCTTVVQVLMIDQIMKNFVKGKNASNTSETQPLTQKQGDYT